MTIDVPVPALGESTTEATVLKWHKMVGEAVGVDETLVELETEKIAIEVPAPAAGVVQEHMVSEGEDVSVGAILCRLQQDEAQKGGTQEAQAPQAPPAEAEATSTLAEPEEDIEAEKAPAQKSPRLAMSVERAAAALGVQPEAATPSGPKGNLVKGDILKAAASPPAPPKPAAPAAAPLAERPVDPRGEERVPMTKLRRAIASRLKEAQNTAAMLTTFNEVNMDNLMDLRQTYKDAFEKKHQVRLGFMSFFAKAAVTALREFPAVNAEIYGSEIIYRNYYDIGIAVGSPKGLVVPVLRNVDALSFSEIEAAIADFGLRARNGKLTPADMTGGSFTITNGGVFGSLLSTPILNPPQSGILGMHTIQNRPICNDDNDIVAARMMYLALSYDHRIVDGREAVTFLTRIKACVEDPVRLIIDV